MVEISEKTRSKASGMKIPAILVRDEIDGKKYYRKGYKDVLAGTKTIDDIIGASVFQAFIVSFIGTYVNGLLPKNWYALTGESGVNLSKKNNLSTDIAIVDINEIGNIFSTKYLDIAPKVVLEVDVKIDLEKGKDYDYIQRKTKKLLEFGVEKVFWILTSQRQVIVAEKENPTWSIINWQTKMEVFENISFSIEQILAEKGFQIPPVEE
ncbi:Uma2 family endonuclease [Emticicia sp. BO119]|nr:Uma2 family endonuclease [Emticicia sp. BO119]